MENKKAIITVLLLVSLIIIPSINAETGHITLLTVGESANVSVGGTADLFLEIKPGTGKVFIDSYPLTKIDTQISTRFAQEVSCNFLNIDCSDKDFFYTIRAKSSIVGGPSAGAAITVLTISMLDGLRLDNETVMTGTINSGGIIGPVAGIKEKADAAKLAGFKKVLIPKWSIISVERSNQSNDSITVNETNFTTINYTIQYADNFTVKGLEIIPVSTIQQALYEFTGKKYPEHLEEIRIPSEYNGIMRNISNDLCDRYEQIMERIPRKLRIEMADDINQSDVSINKSRDAYASGDYYSSASYCFTANSALRKIEFTQYSNESLLKRARDIRGAVNALVNDIDARKLNTISDLETAMIVKERLFEVKDLLNRDQGEVIDNIAYISERYLSALTWSKFFSYNSSERKVILDDNYLADACLSKLAEAEERVSYLELITDNVAGIREDLVQTNKLYEQKDYAFCLFRATRVKADANSVLEAMTVTEDKIPELVADKLNLAKAQINQQSDFPIIGYSYYNYANSLKGTNMELSLVFSEYASEFSNLDMYFPKPVQKKAVIDSEHLAIFLTGFGLGMAIAVFLIIIITRIPKKRKARRR